MLKFQFTLLVSDHSFNKILRYFITFDRSLWRCRRRFPTTQSGAYGLSLSFSWAAKFASLVGRMVSKTEASAGKKWNNRFLKIFSFLNRRRLSSGINQPACEAWMCGCWVGEFKEFDIFGGLLMETSRMQTSQTAAQMSVICYHWTWTLQKLFIAELVTPSSGLPSVVCQQRVRVRSE